MIYLGNVLDLNLTRGSVLVYNIHCSGTATLVYVQACNGAYTMQMLRICVLEDQQRCVLAHMYGCIVWIRASPSPSVDHAMTLPLVWASGHLKHAGCMAAEVCHL
jgi:hypothetical protein